MTIGYDGYNAFLTHSETSYVDRALLTALSETFPRDRFYVYLPQTTSNRAYTHVFAHANISLKTPHKAYSKWWWRNMGGVFKDMKIHHVRVFHGLNGRLPMMSDKRARLVVSIHNATNPSWRERKAAQKAERVIVTSQWAKDALVKRCRIKDPDKVCVVRQGCREDYFNEISPTMLETVRNHYKLPTRYILCPAPFSQNGNIGVLLKALKLLGSEHHDLRLVLVGRKDENYKRLKEQARELGVRDHLVRLDRVKIDYFPVLYRLAEVCVYPSVDDAAGVPVIESLASGCPVVAAQSGCLPEVGGELALYFKPNDHEQLAKQIEAAIAQRHDGTATQYAEHMQQFTQQAMAQKMMEIYKGLSSRS